MEPIIENEDYYINENGLYVFTEKHHLKRGYCCKNGCLHCPWKYKKRKAEGLKPKPKPKNEN